MMHAVPASAISLELLRRFVQNHPDKAVDILMRYGQDQTIQNEVLTHLASPARHGEFEPQSPQEGLGAPVHQTRLTSPPGSQYSIAPPSARNRRPSRTFSTSRPVGP